MWEKLTKLSAREYRLKIGIFNIDTRHIVTVTMWIIISYKLLSVDYDVIEQRDLTKVSARKYRLKIGILNIDTRHINNYYLC